ncbi:DUF1835 domain-containing protein [Algoriphagus limi]|uniref:DUF1835 domain-containing protein n=1 Tax=Algoriphagus limi TaxID=2975273 RepID=A0ABT2G0S4_9BACT|nr:DUF1835 domain-containing protein [Algoriphagus limi]MCS5488854.1 DUF1835 domain-containing protein [Algoriphagus limi]
MRVHILNGDALFEHFPKGITGEKIIFRECLLDGPVNGKSEEEFWQLRKEFIQSDFGQNTDYDSYSKAEILKIKEITSHTEVFLWFEEDLFCQVNLWKAIDLLSAVKDEAFLVTPGSEHPYSFATLDTEGLIERFYSPIQLQREDFYLFAELWTHFQKAEVFEAIQLAEKFKLKFPFLLPAVEAWRDMVPLGDFPGKPVQTLKDIQKEFQTDDFGVIFREFQKRLPIYGMGDLQVKRLWDEINLWN